MGVGFVASALQRRGNSLPASAVHASKLLLLLLIAAASGGSKASPDAVPMAATQREPTKLTSDRERAGQDDAASRETARQFLTDVDKELRELYVDALIAAWANVTDITPEHEAAAAKTEEQWSIGITRFIKASRKFDSVYAKLDADSQRKLLLLKFTGRPAPDDTAQAEELARISTEMTSIYGKGKVCDPESQKAFVDAAAHLNAGVDDKAKAAARNAATEVEAKHCKDLNALSKILQESRNPDELLATWKGWHDTVGKAELSLFIRYVELANAGARAIGFNDVSSSWRSRYDMSEDKFEAEVDRLWGQVSPLYTQLHCYTRRGLNRLHGDKVQPNSGPIFSHLTGNMWGPILDIPLQGARAVRGCLANRRHAGPGEGVRLDRDGEDGRGVLHVDRHAVAAGHVLAAIDVRQTERQGRPLSRERVGRHVQQRPAH
jgi:peptidyl-dipeptidase A